VVAVFLQEGFVWGDGESGGAVVGRIWLGFESCCCCAYKEKRRAERWRGEATWSYRGDAMLDMVCSSTCKGI
jgi:hypothetical protein